MSAYRPEALRDAPPPISDTNPVRTPAWLLIVIVISVAILLAAGMVPQ